MAYQPYDPNQNGPPPANTYQQPGGGYQQPTGPGGFYPPPGQEQQQYPPSGQGYQPPGAPQQQYQPPSDQYTQPLVPKERFDYTANAYRDKGWAILFLVHLLGMAACCAMWGGDLLEYMKEETAGGTTVPPGMLATDPPTTAPFRIDAKIMMVALTLAAIGGGLFAAAWLNIMKKCADTIIKVSLTISCVAMVVCALMALYAGSMVMALFFLILAGLQCLYFYFVRKRIPFTQAVLHASSTSIQDHPGPVFVVYGIVILQVIWLGFWTFATLSIYHHVNKNKGGDTEPDKEPSFSGVNSLAYFLLLVSLYWTAQVLKNVGHVTTAGTVASWWLVPNLGSPTKGAFKRAVTTSFGSICFGSLIVAVLRAMRVMLEQAKRSASRSGNGGAACALACLECILGCLERMMEYFNMYAYTMVAIYGHDFMTAAKATWGLFKSRGFDVLINDDLTGMVLTMGILLGGCFAGIIAGGWASVADHSATSNHSAWVVIGSFGFIVGMVMTSLVMNVIESAVATTYVVWAEDPQAIAQTRPESYNKIAEAARVMHPSRQF